MMRFICVLLLTGAFATPAHADNSLLEPGDKGYRHDQYHELYQGLFDKAECHCQKGECRATVVRRSDAESGFDILIDRAWYPVPQNSIIPSNRVPMSLLTEPAHGCSYEIEDEFTKVRYKVIDCVIINNVV
jgi:hypothetical protein